MDYKIKGTWKMLGRQCVHARCSKYMDVKTFDVERFADFCFEFIGGLDVEEYCHDSRMCIAIIDDVFCSGRVFALPLLGAKHSPPGDKFQKSGGPRATGRETPFHQDSYCQIVSK